MGFPSTEVLPLTPAEGFPRARAAAGRLKTRCIQAKAKLDVGTTSVDEVIRIHDDMVSAKAEFDRVSSIPGIVEFARDQVGDSERDIAGEFVTMTAAVVDGISTIEAGFPSQNGYLLRESWSAGTTNRVVRTVSSLSAGAVTALKTKLQTIIDSIE